MKKLHDHPRRFRVPKPIYLCRDREEIGVPFFIRKFVEVSNESVLRNYKCVRGGGGGGGQYYVDSRLAHFSKKWREII